MSYTMLARQSRVRQRKMLRLGAPDWLTQYLDFALGRIDRRMAEYRKMRSGGAITYAEFQGKYGRCVAELCGVMDVMDAFQWPRLKP